MEEEGLEQITGAGGEHGRPVNGELPALLILYDRDLRIVYLSPQAERITGVPTEICIGRTNREAGLPREFCIPWEPAVERVFLTGAGIDVEFTYAVPAAGGPRLFELKLAPEYAPDGVTVRHVLGIATDVTERRKIEADLRQSEQHYFALAEELREIDRSKNEFLAVLSHELRNPLTPIRTSVRILERQALGGEQARRALQVIERQVGELARVVDDLLDVTRLSVNKLKLSCERLELNAFIERVVEDHRPLCEERGLALVAEYAPMAVYIQADALRLAQIIANLLQNAVQFTDRGGKVTVAVCGDYLKRRAAIHVGDTGVGIKAEMLPRLFQPFTQAEASCTGNHGGLGLGLALVKGLVELHGGQVRAFSEGSGRGSEFVVRLPLDLATSQTRPAGQGEPSRRRRRVLIIEDYGDLARSLGELLELDGHEVKVAAGGAEGLEMARDFQPEVLLCDIGLPGMDGYAVARSFRAEASFRDVFLVALTGFARPEDIKLAEEAGFDAHLAKPPDLDALAQALARAPERAPVDAICDIMEE